MTPFTITTNNTRYLGVTLTKQVKDLFDKNFKSLKKEIEEDLIRWQDITSSCFGKANIVKKKKWPSCLKQSTDSRQSPSKFQFNSS